jgi:hypothetical protein
MVPAVLIAISSALKSATRFGTSSPKTNEKYAITNVTPRSEIVVLQPVEIPRDSSHGIT